VAGGRRYTDTEVERGLVALALYQGNARRASRELNKQGINIPFKTLYDWRHSKADRLASVRESILPVVKAELAENHTDLAKLQLEASRQATAQILHKLKEETDLTATQLATVTRSMDIGSGIHTENASKLRGEPQLIVEHRSAKEIEQRLVDMGVLDVEAVEIEDTPQLPPAA
jgi:hypothetical protein